MTKKSWALLGVSILGLLGVVLKAIPQTAPAGPAVQEAARQLKEHVQALPDPCGPQVCAGGAIHGLVGFPDGGATCECP